MAAAAVRKSLQGNEDTELLNENLMILSNIGRVVDGSGQFAYRSLSCVEKRVGPIKCIEGYPHLQAVDLSHNYIKDVAPLKSLQYLIRLNLSSNSIEKLKPWDVEEGVFPHLLDLNLSGNHLKELPALSMKVLRTADFSYNDIGSTQEFKGHERLEVLKLSDNKLQSLSNIANLPVLKRLDVARNQLTSIEGLTAPLLEDLSIAGCQFIQLLGNWQELPALKTLDMSENKVQTCDSLEVLRSLPQLRDLQVNGNPLQEVTADWRIEVLRRHWRLQVLDSTAVTAE